ncbi:Fe(3+)-hydroxamate ABC transporter permease FhuB [Segnochrobactrum spirostomi]|uniref:Fe(3+)-hydroxamate ABC transporter permease FhuB n=1 Tax=Segnochrobactrum spirostomi TaxID=2608987 RepID=A0A6A7Y726_9HYPH|nr:Fe(3+)-hydroxamate ABC transporter permease FhuB [Segnochrobactrum spirostomi]MQT15084.1 Fe(3+)-hydroxamate ABC transporter permease FhuB [Segnochrobactrum spirostomi]
MSIATLPFGSSRRSAVWGPIALAGGLGLLAIVATVMSLASALPMVRWPAALAAPDLDDIGQAVVVFSVLPRVAVALLAGAGLALAGTLLQQVLRNPLAEPATLGIAAGAHLALALATLFAPVLLVFGRDAVALGGAALATAAVLGLSWRHGFAPVHVVLAGLVVGLYCGASAALLVLLHERYLEGLFLWGAGSLVQQDWTATVALLPRLIVVAGFVAVLARPFAMLDLGDEAARGVGLPVARVRFAGLALAVALTGFVVASIGVIGFIGLIAPTLARLTGARTFRMRLWTAPLIGAALLWLTDQLVQRLSGAGGELLPAGAVTALLGAPLLFWMLPRLRFEPPRAAVAGPVLRRAGRGRVLGLAAALALVTIFALVVGRTPDGHWGTAFGDLAAWERALPWRWPRIVAALAAGTMLALAGTLLQRLTANPMASPEVLGISSGAAFGLLAVLLLVADLGRLGQFAAACCGALVALLAILALNRRSSFAPERVLIAGLALGALLDALVGVLMASGDPRALRMLNWLAGSTYGVDGHAALMALGLALVLAAVAPLLARWLDLMPLGARTASAVGVDVARARGAVLLVAAALTAGGTLAVGPLSFVGLMAPHLARRLGFRRAGGEIAGAALVGAALMVAADWLGRVIDFPRQMPAGLVAAVIGAPLLMVLLRGRRR